MTKVPIKGVFRRSGRIPLRGKRREVAVGRWDGNFLINLPWRVHGRAMQSNERLLAPPQVPAARCVSRKLEVY
jgi:hypothetical protein